MKRSLVFLMMAVLMIGSICLATDENITTVGLDDALENASDTVGDYGDHTTTDESTVNLDDYSDFFNAYNETGTQDELREYYREFLAYSRSEDAKKTENKRIKAKVVEVKDVKTTYSMDYYTPYKIESQPIKVEILEGEYKGKIFDVQYVLTADTYQNIKIPQVKVGDKVFVTVAKDDSSEEVQAYTVSYDMRTEKLPYAIILLIAMAILLGVFGKVKGMKTLLLICLIFDLVFVVTLPIIVQSNSSVTLESGDKNFPTKEEIAADESIAILAENDSKEPTKVQIVKKSNAFVFVAIIDAVVITAVCVINQLGLNKKALCAVGITLCALVFAVLLAWGMNLLTGMNGNMFEAITSAESIVNKNIDFGAIYMLTILVIGSVAISNVVSKVFATYGNAEYASESKEFLSSQISVVAVISLVLLMLKTMVLMIFKYSLNDLLNSEMVIGEIVRMMVIIITMALAMFGTELIHKKKNKVQE